MDASKRRYSREIVNNVLGADDDLARIATLTDAVRAGGNVEAEIELIRLRHQVWRTGQYPDPPQHWPPAAAGLDVSGAPIPMVNASELTTEVLQNAIARKSCLLVRGLMPEAKADALVAGTDQALDACRRRQAGEVDSALASWFMPFVPEGRDDSLLSARRWAVAAGTVFAADSPRNFAHVLDFCESMGVLDLLTDYFGVRPVMSVPKTALKLVAPDAPGGWHQDARAYGEQTRALNMWVALTPCGIQAPGLALVPVNPGGFVEDTPPPPQMVPISEATISRLGAEGAPVQEPVFEKGDVLFFDTFLPHQTQQGRMFTQERYALECWFFSPTTVSENWIPLHI